MMDSRPSRSYAATAYRGGRMTLKIRSLLLVVLLATLPLSARVISYSPYTDRVAIPAQQERTNRYFVLIEAAPPPLHNAAMLPFVNGQVVLYDSRDEFEPRVIYPADGTFAVIGAAAVREDENGVPVVLIQTVTSNAQGVHNITRLSIDAG